MIMGLTRVDVIIFQKENDTLFVSGNVQRHSRKLRNH